MVMKHKTSHIQETNNRKFITDKEKEIVENIAQYNSSNHTFNKSINLNNTKNLIIPRINIEGETYQNILDMGTGINYHTYNVVNNEVAKVYSDNDFIVIKNKTRTDSILLWINSGNIVELIKPSTDYTLILDYYSNKEITKITTQLMGHDVRNHNSASVSTNVNKRTGRVFINIRTNENIDKTNPSKACIYINAAVKNLAVDDFFYFGNAKLFKGRYTESDYHPYGRIHGITGVGDKSRNLFNPKLIKRNSLNINDGAIGEQNNEYIISDFIPVVGGAQYLLYDELGEYASSRYIIEYDTNKNFIKSTNIKYSVFFNSKRTQLRNNTAYVIIRFWSADKYNGLNSISPNFSPCMNIMFRKDSYEPSMFEPYYEDYKISIRTRGSNIFDATNLVTGNIRGTNTSTWWLHDANHEQLTGETINQSYPRFVSGKRLIKIKANTRYVVKRDVNFNNLNIKVEKIMFFDENKRCVCGDIDAYSQFGAYSPNFSFTTHNNAVYMRLVFFTSEEVSLSPSDVEKCNFTISEIETSESYKGDECDIYLDRPLMKIPQGSKDEIKDGYLIRRVGKLVLNGSESWILRGPTNFVELRLTDCKEGSKLLCDSLIVRDDVNPDKVSQNSDNIGVMATLDGSIRIRHRVDIETVDEVKEWLKNNNVTLYYELKTPIITKINQSGLTVYDNFTELYTDNNLASSKQFTLPGNMNSRLSTNKDRLMSLKERMSKIEQISLTSVLNVIDLKGGDDNEI